MNPGSYDLTIYQGTTFRRQVRLVQNVTATQTAKAKSTTLKITPLGVDVPANTTWMFRYQNVTSGSATLSSPLIAGNSIAAVTPLESTIWQFSSASGPAIDLSGSTARAQIRQHYQSDLLSEIDCTITNPSAGIVDLLLTDTQTAALSANLIRADRADNKAISRTPYVWDLEIVASNGDVLRVLQGDVLISPEVTR